MNDEQRIDTEKKPYVPPAVETHRPMDIMSKYDDQSSDLDF